MVRAKCERPLLSAHPTLAQVTEQKDTIEKLDDLNRELAEEHGERAGDQAEIEALKEILEER